MKMVKKVRAQEIKSSRMQEGTNKQLEGKNQLLATGRSEVLFQTLDSN